MQFGNLGDFKKCSMYMHFIFRHPENVERKMNFLPEKGYILHLHITFIFIKRVGRLLLPAVYGKK